MILLRIGKKYSNKDSKNIILRNNDKIFNNGCNNF